MITYTSSRQTFEAGNQREKILPRSVTFRPFAPETFSGRVKALIAIAKGGRKDMRTSQGGRRTGLRTAVKTQATTLMSIILFGALLLVPTSKVNAQIECLGACEERLVECLRNSGTSQQFSPGCVQSFENCVNECLGNSAAVLFG